MGGPECTSGAGGPRRWVHARGEDRRRGGEPHLRRWPAHRRRDARQWHGGRGRDRQSAHDRGGPAAAQRKDLAQADGGARRGVSLQVAVRGAQPGARASRRAHVRQSPQRSGGSAAPARPQGHAQPRAPDVLLPHRSARSEADGGDAACTARAAGRLGLPGGAPPHAGARPGAGAAGGGDARGPAAAARLRRRRRRRESEPAAAARRARDGGRPGAALGGGPQVRA